MKFHVTGRDHSSGQPIEMVIEAADAQAALASAQGRSIIVDTLNLVSAGPVVPPPIHYPQSQHSHALVRSPRKIGLRKGTVLLMLAGVTGAIIKPVIGFLFFGLLILPIVLYVIPGTRRLSRTALGLQIGRPFATAMKLIYVGLLALVMLLVSIGSQGAKAARQQAEEDRVKADTHKQQQIAEGNAKVDTLMAAVKGRMDAGDVAGASTTLTEALKIQHATNKGPAQRLQESIALSRDSASIRGKIVKLSEEEFAAFASGGKVPGVFNLGYPVLNDAVVALARPMVAEVKIARTALANRRAEEAEQRRKDDLARAEAERKERERAAAAEAAAKAIAQKEIKNKLDAYMAALELDEFASKIVASVAVERSGDIWTATITVKNLWHVRNKQLRLQDAQNLWQAWAVLASKNNPDRARINLVDLNANKVGGSRALGGSLIWVQD